MDNDCRALETNTDKRLYTCCVCCCCFLPQDRISVRGRQYEHVCSQACAYTFSHTLAFLEGFILCKVIVDCTEIFIEKHFEQIQTKSQSKPRRDSDKHVESTQLKQVLCIEKPEKYLKTEDSLRVLEACAVSSHEEPATFGDHLSCSPRQKPVLQKKSTRAIRRLEKKTSSTVLLKKSHSKLPSLPSQNQTKEPLQYDPIMFTTRVRRKLKAESIGDQSSGASAFDKTLTYTCSECGRKFSTRKTLKAHLKIKHKKDMSDNKVCRICGQGFLRQAGLSLHMASKHHGEKAVECESCGEQFSSSMDCDRHMTLVHGKERGVCHICGKHFKYMHTLQAHVRAHTGVRAFVCEFCGKGFLRQTTLIDHKKRHFCKGCKQNLAVCECPRQERKITKRVCVAPNGGFQCSFCRAALETLDLYETHITAHKMEWPYGCTVCEKRFMDKTGLRAHMHQHRDKRFQCDVCHKSFTYKCNLKIHRKNHDVEGRPFACDVCQKTFKTDMALKVHRRTHLEERRVNCHLCGRSLSRLNNLKRHLRVMHPDHASG